VNVERCARLLVQRVIAEAWWHGSPSGQYHPKHYGIHIGTRDAARTALEAKIGFRADGKDWDGTQEYGKTLLAGKATLQNIEKQRGTRYLDTGFNCGEDFPDEDFYCYQRKYKARYPDGTLVPLDCKPDLYRVEITGEMTNDPASFVSDTYANSRMMGQQKRGQARRGYYYKNDAEDYGSISAVLPGGGHLRRLS
jgi:hypothetical protein